MNCETVKELLWGYCKGELSQQEKAELSAKKLADTYGVFARGYACDIGNEQQVIDIFL